ncbi:hypothetical protein [Roseateles puraquae]|jgi:hypothetical protein|uniref:hypothetical protein n=1 Tax=Roseateles puraquae TaxID=431059 RepID=UPI0031D21055
MSKSLDELLTKLPEWLGEFTRTLAHPSRVLAEQLSTAAPASGEAGGPAPGKPVQDGAAFLILSFAVAAGVAIAFPVASMDSLDATPSDGVLARSAVVLRHLFVFLAAAAIVHGASRLLGNRQAFAGFFGAVARFGGATLVLLALAGALTNIGMADPVAARNWQELRQITQQMGEGARTLACAADAKTGVPAPGAAVPSLDPAQLARGQALYLDTAARPLMLVASGLEFLCLLALTVWLGWVWWRYLRVSQLTPARALAASALGVTGLGAGYLVLVLIDSGQRVSSLMQTCPQP